MVDGYSGEWDFDEKGLHVRLNEENRVCLFGKVAKQLGNEIPFKGADQKSL